VRPLFFALAIFGVLGCGDDVQPDAPVPADKDSTTPATVCAVGDALAECASPTSVTRCSDDGTRWLETQCEDGLLCFGGKCVDYPCLPGDQGCTDSQTKSACLQDDSGAYGWVALEVCDGLCKAGACVGNCTYDVKQNIGKACSHHIIELTGTGTGDCPETTLLAVPSSGNGSLALFDISAEPPVLALGSPFATCDDPSRIMVTGGDVVATCRGDGHVVRHAVASDVIWDRHLPGCEGARGIARLPDGRLFAGCTSTQNVHELDWDSGEVSDTQATDLQVYGMAADDEALFVMDYTSLVRVDPNPLNVAWAVPIQAYGIAVDGKDRVWLSGETGLEARSTADGSVLQTVDLSGSLTPAEDTDNPTCNGVAIAPDGRVITGCADNGDVVVIHDPESGVTDLLALPLTEKHPRGVAIDTSGHIYSINLLTESLTRFHATTGESLTFGHGALEMPYGYSGDLTGIHPCVLADSGPTVWTGPVVDLGAADTTWLALEWRETRPPGTTIAVSYRIDGGAWAETTSGAPINKQGQTLQARALLSAAGQDQPVLHELAILHE